MNKSLLVVSMVAVAVVILSGCLEPTCNKPYILVGDDCCLDENDNGICDRDDGSSTLYENSDYGFSIEYPNDWDIEEYEEEYTVVTFYKDIGASYYIIYISVQEASEYTLNQWVGFTKYDNERIYGEDNYNIFDEGSLTVGGKTAYFLESVYTYDGAIMREKEILLTDEGNLYSIVYISSYGRYGDSIGEFDSSVSTFKFI